MSTATLPDLRGLTEAELVALATADDDSTGRGAVWAELDRRETAAQLRAARRMADSAWAEAAHAQMLKADRVCRGNLVSRRGQAAGVTDWSLWSGPAHVAEANATEELRNFWRDVSPRMTVTRYREGLAASRRDERAAVDDQPATGEATAMGLTGDAVRAGEAVARAANGVARGAQVRQDYQAARTRTAERNEAQQAAQAAALRGAVAVQDAMASQAVRQQRPRPQETVICGADVLAYVRAWLGRFVCMDDAALDLVTAWAAHASARDAGRELIWRASPRLLVTSAEAGTGKSTVMRMLGMLLGSKGRMPKVSPAKLAEVIGGRHETVFLDEARLMFGNGNASAELQRILLDGYLPGGYYSVSGKDLHLFGPVCYAGKNDLLALAQPGTSLGDLLTRTLPLELFRPAVRMPELDEDGEMFGRMLAQALPAWAAQERAALKARAAELGKGGDVITEGDGGRMGQISRPLLACCDIAGGDWPERIRAALEDITAGKAATMMSGLAGLSEKLGLFGAGGGEYGDDES